MSRAFSLHAADPGLINLSLSERPANYQEYPPCTGEPVWLTVVYSICQKPVTSLTMQMLLVPAWENKWTTEWQCYTSSPQGLLLALHSGLFLEVLLGPYGMPGIKPGLTSCKVNTLPSVLSRRLMNKCTMLLQCNSSTTKLLNDYSIQHREGTFCSCGWSILDPS